MENSAKTAQYSQFCAVLVCQSVGVIPPYDGLLLLRPRVQHFRGSAKQCAKTQEQYFEDVLK